MKRPFDAYRGDGPYVFASYSHEDEEIVYPLLEWLHASSVNVWYDEGVSAGSRWSDHIAQAIEGASIVLFLVTKASTQSDNCQDEISYALDKKKKLAIVYLDDVELRGGLRLRLGPIQGINHNDLSENDFRRKVLDALALDAGTSPDTTRVPVRSGMSRLYIAAALLSVLVVVVVGVLLTVVVFRHESAPVKIAAPAHKQSAQPANTIAVLPFTNLSGNPDNQYFSDGVAAEILNALGHIQQLKVAAVASSFYFRSSSQPIKGIAQKLGVANLLEGSVQRVGDRVRISVQLVQADTGFEIWTESYDRDLHDIFAVQQNIAQAVADALKVKFKLAPSIAVERGTKNVEAYNAYLKGTYYIRWSNTTDAAHAITELKRAVKLDPHYDKALGALAWAYVYLDFATNTLDIEQDWESAIDAALAQDPDNPEALASKGVYLSVVDFNRKDAALLWARARSSPMVTRLYPGFMADLSDAKDAASAYEQALDKDPYNIDLLMDAALRADAFGTFAKTLSYSERALAISPGDPYAISLKAAALAGLNKKTEAKNLLNQIDITSPTISAYALDQTAILAYQLGETKKADVIMNIMKSRMQRDYVYKVPYAFFLALTDRKDQAIKLLGQMYKERNFGLRYLRWPSFDALRGDPRFERLLKKVNLDDAYVSQIRMPGL